MRAPGRDPLAGGIGNSVTAPVAGSTCPTRLARMARSVPAVAVNHTLPSEPAARLTFSTSGCPSNDGMLNVVIWPAGVMCPSLLVVSDPLLANVLRGQGPG
jgi:hypothetical protein